MHFGYPGENTHLEHHGVSEESFWPSFTDIMMVIVMVFLLVTVAVILNNWTLITDLKDSIKAQQVASSLAENTQEQNHTLEDKLSALENQVEDLSKKYQDEKSKLLATQQELAQTRRFLLEKETSLSTLETKLIALQAELSTSNTLINERTKVEQLLQRQLEQKISEKEKDASALDNLKSEQSKTQKQLEQLQVDYSKLQTLLKNAALTAKNSQTAFAELEKTQQGLKQKLETTTQTLDQLEQEKTRRIAALTAKLEQRDDELEAKNKQLLAFKENKTTEEAQLRSLQGEYDTLDAKYQKLLLPARSSKGKFVVSVLYRKTAGKKVIRLKTDSAGTYQPISQKQLHNKLTALKNKHKTNLYLKVVIPENSGLSYSEAWKFTNGLQKQYDYYFQEKSN